MPVLFNSKEEYTTEKIMNVVVFSIAVGGYFLVYSFLYEKAAEQVEISRNRVENLLRILIHDIGNPITVILALLDLLMSKKGKTEELLKIKAAAQNAAEQIERIHQLKSMEDGKTKVLISDELIINMLGKFYEQIELKLLEKEIYIDKKIDILESEILAWHKVNFINQILMNVFSNAIDTKENHGTCFTLIFPKVNQT